MRFVWAVAAFVLAALLIGAGVLQRTVFLGPETTTSSVQTVGRHAYTLIDGDVLNAHPGAQTLIVRGEGQVFLAYGTKTDVEAWIGEAGHNRISLGKDGRITSTSIDAAEGVGAVKRDPKGSDLWLDEFVDENAVTTHLQLPSKFSLLVAADGVEVAPTDLTFTWPRDNATPWAGPLVVAGGFFFLVGIVMYILAVRHMRRSRGPRRKGLPQADVPPAEIESGEIEEADARGVTAQSPQRRSRPGPRRGQRAFVGVTFALVSAVALSGCSADFWPEAGVSVTPTPSASVIVPEGQLPPVVTQAQAERIIGNVSATIAEADEKTDEKLAETRLSGSALAVRKANYTLREEFDKKAKKAEEEKKKADDKDKDKDKDKEKKEEAPKVEPLPAIPSKPVEVLLPQAFDGWPRTIMAVVQDKENTTTPPSIMMLVQSDPWSPYKVDYLAAMEAGAALPKLAPANIGAAQVPPASSFLTLSPEELATAYSDILDRDDKSDWVSNFDYENDKYREQVSAVRTKNREAFIKEGYAKTAKLTYSAEPGPDAPLALATLETGAIVAINIVEKDTVVPTNKDAEILLSSNPRAAALAGTDKSSTGFVASYRDQLFFYVPAKGSDEKIRLLAYTSEMQSADVIKKSEEEEKK